MTLRSALREDLINFLAEDGIILEKLGNGAHYRVSPDSAREYAHAPVFEIDEDLLHEYLLQMSKTLPGDAEESLGEALSLTQIHAMEYLATDHGGGVNRTSRLGFRRNRLGIVEFFVDRGSAVGGVNPSGRDGELYGWTAERP